VSESRGATPGRNRRIVIAANSSWNIVNFRAGLVRALKAAGYRPVVVAPVDPESTERLRALGVRHIPLDLNRSGMNPLGDARLIMAYRRILKRIEPTAYLGFTIKPNVYGAIAARMAGVPMIANISGLGTAFAKRGVLRSAVSRLYRLSLGKAAVVFFQNADDQAEFLSEALVRPEQARLLPGSGVDLAYFTPTPLPPGPPVFLLIARLLADKGIREYAAAARLLRGAYPDARFQLLGPLDTGNPTAIGRDELDGWVREGLIDYLGTSEDVRPFIRKATAVVLPSFYREGVPRSLLEGAAMARPLITTDEPGCRELLVNGDSAIACRARDPRDLARAMETMITMSPKERRAMGLAARRLVEARFGEALVCAAYLEALDLAQANSSKPG
jgi:glycosyltransferase involved in cell wall biosynthesis